MGSLPGLCVPCVRHCPARRRRAPEHGARRIRRHGGRASIVSPREQIVKRRLPSKAKRLTNVVLNQHHPDSKAHRCLLQLLHRLPHEAPQRPAGRALQDDPEAQRRHKVRLHHGAH